MVCAVLNDRSCSRASVSASSVDVVPPSPARASSLDRIELGRLNRRRDEPERADGVAEHRRHQRLQVVLGVDDVAEGRVVDGADDGLRLAERLAADGARVLDGHRVALLRHDAARLHEAVAEAHVAELERAPEQQVLHEAAEAGHRDRRRRDAFEQVVHRGDAAVRVARRALEAEQLARLLAVDRKPRAGDRARCPAGSGSSSGRRRGAAWHRARPARSRRAGSARPCSAARAACACGPRRRSLGASAPRSSIPSRSASVPSYSDRMNSRCRIRYIVMSMSLRLRAVWRRPATSSPQAWTSRPST